MARLNCSSDRPSAPEASPHAVRTGMTFFAAVPTPRSCFAAIVKPGSSKGVEAANDLRLPENLRAFRPEPSRVSNEIIACSFAAAVFTPRAIPAAATIPIPAAVATAARPMNAPIARKRWPAEAAPRPAELNAAEARARPWPSMVTLRFAMLPPGPPLLLASAVPDPPPNLTDAHRHDLSSPKAEDVKQQAPVPLVQLADRKSDVWGKGV